MLAAAALAAHGRQANSETAAGAGLRVLIGVADGRLIVGRGHSRKLVGGRALGAPGGARLPGFVLSLVLLEGFVVFAHTLRVPNTRQMNQDGVLVGLFAHPADALRLMFGASELR